MFVTKNNFIFTIIFVMTALNCKKKLKFGVV